MPSSIYSFHIAQHLFWVMGPPQIKSQLATLLDPYRAQTEAAPSLLRARIQNQAAPWSIHIQTVHPAHFFSPQQKTSVHGGIYTLRVSPKQRCCRIWIPEPKYLWPPKQSAHAKVPAWLGLRAAVACAMWHLGGRMVHGCGILTEDHQGVFWCTGSSGAGKSTLASLFPRERILADESLFLEHKSAHGFSKHRFSKHRFSKQDLPKLWPSPWWWGNAPQIPKPCLGILHLQHAAQTQPPCVQSLKLGQTLRLICNQSFTPQFATPFKNIKETTMPSKELFTQSARLAAVIPGFMLRFPLNKHHTQTLLRDLYAFILSKKARHAS